MPAEWLADLLTQVFGTDGYLTGRSIVALLLVCSLCGMVGAQVVGNRMAFFSDTMAHAAFAGVALGYITLIVAGVDRRSPASDNIVLLVMVLFGAGVGVSIVSLRESTGLANDTVIGVFFALAIGFGAMLFQVLQEMRSFNPEQFLFGSLVFVFEEDLLNLILVCILTAAVVGWRYNQMVFASFHPGLARTRRVNLPLNNYLFIVVLALVVNLSIKAVGALLVNALLVVPAATAAGVARNLRQMFWLTIGYCIAAGLLGFALSSVIVLGHAGHGTQRKELKFGPSGTIVVVSVMLFFGSLLAVKLRRRVTR